MKRHTEKRYIIFGADGGIGQAVSKFLHASGAKLTLVGGPDESKLDALGAQVADAPRLSIDATASSQVKEAFDAAIHAVGDVDGVVYCIGSFGLEPIESVTDEKVDAIIALNLRTAIYIAREIAQRFKQARRAFSAVFVSSAAAQHGMPNQEVLSAAKGGVEALIRSLASTLAPNIRINGVAPGLIATPLTQELRSKQSPSDSSRAMFAMRQFGNAEQIAEAVAFLLDAEHTFVTGQVWAMDGGLTTVHVKPYEHIEPDNAKPRSERPEPSQRLSDHIEAQAELADQTATG